MKKLSGYFFLACMFSLFLGMTSCKKGDVGPAGPKGAQGEKGDQGAPGVANVIYSDWLDASFKYDSTNSVYFWDIDAPKVTSDILVSGTVKIYINLSTDDQPLIATVPYFDGGVYIRDLLLEGGIELVSNYNVGTAQDNNGKKYYQYRYVIIPGGVAARTKSTIDWNDYAQVKKYLNLKD